MTVSLSSFMGDLLRDRLYAEDAASAQHEVIIISDNCRITEDRWIQNRLNFAAPATLGKCRWSSHPDLLELHSTSSSPPIRTPVDRRHSIGCIRDSNTTWVDYQMDITAFASPVPSTTVPDSVPDVPLTLSPSALKADREKLLKRLYSELSAPQRPQRVVSPEANNSKPSVDSAGLLQKMQETSHNQNILGSNQNLSSDVLEMPRRKNSFTANSTSNKGRRTLI